MEDKIRLQELWMDCCQDMKNWECQMLLLAEDPILYREEYQCIPEEIYRFKMDEELHPAAGEITVQDFLSRCGKENEERQRRPPIPRVLSIGIGTYRTETDGELYLCVLLDRQTRQACAYSFGIYRSGELAEKALEILFSLYDTADMEDECTLLCSQNPIYKTRCFQEAAAAFPIRLLMTQKGTRGGAAVVSTFFSQLMRRKGSTVFQTWQDAIDWITWDILKYNLTKDKIKGKLAGGNRDEN